MNVTCSQETLDLAATFPWLCCTSYRLWKLPLQTAQRTSSLCILNGTLGTSNGTLDRVSVSSELLLEILHGLWRLSTSKGPRSGYRLSLDHVAPHKGSSKPPATTLIRTLKGRYSIDHGLASSGIVSQLSSQWSVSESWALHKKDTWPPTEELTSSAHEFAYWSERSRATSEVVPIEDT